MTYPDLESEWDRANLGTNYVAFLLRCWLEETNGEPAWRFTLVQLGDKGLKRGFASLEDMTAYLRLALAARARPPDRTAYRVQQKEGEQK